MFLCRDIEFSNKLDFCDMFVANDYFLKIQYLDKGTFFSAETFRIFWESLTLSMGKISDQNSIIWFFSESLVIGNKSTKVIITRKGRPMGTYAFRLFLVSSDPTYGQNISSKALNHFGRFPRELKIFVEILKTTSNRWFWPSYSD
jgi:hypothetical protein